MINQNKYKDFFIILLLALFSFFIVLNPQILLPTRTNWIASGDPAAAYLGWVFFRNTSWVLPLGLLPNYGIGLDASLVYTDTVPLLAYFFKLLGPVLPNKFQFFGIWYLIIFIGQSYFGWKLSNLITNDRLLNVFITLIFIFTPAYLAIIGVWSSEAAHFLILAALFLILKNNHPTNVWRWPALLVLSVSICFYIFLMVSVLWFSNILDNFFIKKKINFKNLWVEIFYAVFFSFVAAWLAGYFSILGGESNNDIQNLGNYGYGVATYSFDMLSPFYGDNWSYILRGLPDSLAPKYSFNYLGLGLVIGFLILLLNFKFFLLHAVNFAKQNIFLLICLLLLLIVGVTNVIRIGPLIFSIPIPDSILSIASIVRASNRLVWPLYYLLIFVILKVICSVYKGNKAKIIIVSIFIIQLIDLSAGWIPLRQSTGKNSAPMYVDYLKDDLWSMNEINRYKNIKRIPMEGPKTEGDQGVSSWEIFGHYAGEHKMGLNYVVLARENKFKNTLLNNQLDESIKSGRYDKDSIYIVDDSHVMPVLRHLNSNNDVFARIDGFNVLLPGWGTCAECPQISPKKLILDTPIPDKNISQLIRFGKNQVGSSYLLGVGQADKVGWGWSYPESWGVWAEGSKARIVMPLPEGFKPTMFVAEVQTYISSAHPIQEVSIFVNNSPQGVIRLNKSTEIIEVPLPNNLYKDYVLIEFRFRNTVSPKEIGLGDDIRRLSIGLISGFFK